MHESFGDPESEGVESDGGGEPDESDDPDDPDDPDDGLLLESEELLELLELLDSDEPLELLELLEDDPQQLSPMITGPECA